jgi:hypothetical protein
MNMPRKIPRKIPAEPNDWPKGMGKVTQENAWKLALLIWAFLAVAYF